MRNVIAFVGLLITSQSLAQDDWPRFRGPTGQGLVVGKCSVGNEFGLEKGLKWRAEIPGKGWSSPVIANGKIWLTMSITQKATQEEAEARLAREKNKDLKEVAGMVQVHAISVDVASGNIIDNVMLGEFEDPDPINPLNTYASPTPVVDNGRIYCHFGTYGTWCLDATTAKVLWKQRIEIDHSVGPGSSPVVQGHNLILVCDGIDAQFVTSLNTSDGKVRWRTKRPPMRAEHVEMHKAYTTPIAIEVAGKPQIVTPTAQWLCAYDPESGEELWRCEHGDGFSTSPSPVYWQGLIVFSTGYMRPELVAVRPDGRGDITKTHIAWRSKRGAPNKPSPIGVGKYLYAISDTGILTQWNANGEELWQERLGGNFSASPIACGDRIFLMSHESTVTILQAGENYQQLARNELTGEGRIMASPAVANGNLFIRTEHSLLKF
jgi:outer membrane protein assembly factor BamB